MYCTGGIRCEMASAYIKSKGAGFENVFQLYGGIQRYLEQFPDGGFFKGKNFVFDHRVSVGSMDPKVLGSCLLCSSAFDDYSFRSRCMYCRMLVLVCDSCRKHSSSYVCELCQKYGKNVVESHELESAELEPVSTSNQSGLFASMSVGSAPKISRKLRILCLHGFRQNASSFKGRTGSLAKKLKNLAELVFVDAPHELSFIYQPSQLEQNSNIPPSPILQAPPPSKSCNKKYAWLVSHSHDKNTETGWRIADIPFDPLQYQQQTEGLDVSLAYLEKVVAQSGPFDGVLGFSQGAAMAALLCQDKLKSKIDFRFVILCSGFSVNMGECQQGSIIFPSLHIFGNDLGKDRQIERDASRHLASLFEGGCSMVIEHELGHIIPTRSPYIDEIKEFLQRFL
ncbi:hypothetical protein Leryth_001409 [Lithospermum erythrorhizon]|nr:hypothetical protein Leryth_001409 [Lithospermum erythrorhizon]